MNNTMEPMEKGAQEFGEFGNIYFPMLNHIHFIYSKT
jgi:hypothetical protein